MLRTFVTSLVSVFAFIASASADVIPGSQKNVQGWTLAAYDVKGKGFSHCGIFVDYRSGITLHFAIFANRAWSIAWRHDSWNFRPGQRVAMQLHVDGVGPQNLSAVAQTRNFLIADLPASAALYDQVRRGNQMTIQTQAGRLGFALDGTSASLSELTACVDRFSGIAQAPQTPAPQAAAAQGPRRRSRCPKYRRPRRRWPPRLPRHHRPPPATGRCRTG